MRITEGVLERGDLTTWYQVVGDLGADDTRSPVVVCHGGPGLTHDYLSPLGVLAESGRPVVFYDQFGSGRSGHRPGADAAFWTVPLFLRELTDLIAHLGIGEYHLLGHSWGGMLGLELAAQAPAGLRSLVVADAFARSRTYSREVAGLVAALPEDVRSTIERHEAAGSTEHPEYQEAVRAFYRLHVCRCRPVPGDVLRTLGALAEDPTVYLAMAGPSEFRLTGNLRDWDITGRLGGVRAEVLIVSGRHDEVTPGAVAELHAALPGSRWELIEDASHMPHLETPGRFLELVEKFLDGADGVRP
ncbi:proline iminopeptidase-family hydrolase [Actinoplanes sp. NPDC049681]|uniref:proline iminopeptidase-family hydrolase n=1 Tax=Actinoplanes sp. NPDC049681 TaxID=3363905 RepID=UPI003792FC42